MSQPRQALELTSEMRKDVSIVFVKGRITIGKVEEFDKYLLALQDDGVRKFILDLQGMDHIDSCGIGVLICFNERIRKANGAIRIVNTHPKVQKIFNMMSLDTFFTIDTDVEHALRSIEEASR
jgi:anti-anti-sigma factor